MSVNTEFWVRRPERDEDTYVPHLPLTPRATEIEGLCMAHILEAFTDEEIRLIRNSIEQTDASDRAAWLWFMFDSISVTPTPEVAS